MPLLGHLSLRALPSTRILARRALATASEINKKPDNTLYYLGGGAALIGLWYVFAKDPSAATTEKKEAQ